MTVKITKPALNLREELNKLDKPSGITGESLLRADTAADAKKTLGIDNFEQVSVSTDGVISADGLNLGDSDKIQLGAGNDLQLYHDGTHSYVKDAGTGNLILQGNSYVEIKGTNNEYMAFFRQDGQAALYYDASKKIETTSSGIDVTGTIVSYGVKSVDNLELSADHDSNSSAGYSNIVFKTDGSERARLTSEGRLGLGVGAPTTTLHVDGEARFYRSNGSSNTYTFESDHFAAIQITGDMDSSHGGPFYNKLVTSGSNGRLEFRANDVAKMTMTQAGSVGIGSTGPSQKLHVEGGNVLVKESATAGAVFLSNTSVGIKRSNAVDSANARDIEVFTDGAGGNVILSANGAGSAEVVVSDDRNVGIGSTSPSNTLELKKDSNGHGLTIFQDNTSFGYHSTIRFRQSNGSSYAETATIRAYGETNGANGSLRFYTNGGNERLRLDHTGKASLGTTLNTSTLNIGANVPSVRFYDSNLTTRQMEINAENGNAIIKVDPNQTEGVSYFAVEVDAVEALRVDSAKNFLVGKTTQGGNTAGFEVRSDGDTLISRDGNRALFLNRKTTDGNILDFAKDGTTVGKIGAYYSGLYIGTTQGSDSFLFFEENIIRPASSTGANRDNAIDLGRSISRFKNLRLSEDAYVRQVRGQNDDDTKIEFPDNNVIKVHTGGSERARFDASGNLFVGTTDIDLGFTDGDTGFMVSPTGYVQSARDSANANVYVNKLNNNGTLVQFAKDGTTVGSIGNNSGGMYVGSGDTGVTFEASLNSIIPTNTLNGSYTNGQVDIGYSTTKFKDLYLSGGAYLGGTAAANKLDDYEEGSHEPTVTPQTSGTITLVSNTDTLSYTKVGRLVNVFGRITVDSVSSPVGNYLDVSLPFSVAALTQDSDFSGGAVAYYHPTNGHSVLPCNMSSSGAIVRIHVDASTIAASHQFRFMISYQTT